MCRQLFWRVHLAHVAKVMISDQSSYSTAHSLDVEFHTSPVNLSQPLLPFEPFVTGCVEVIR